MSFVVLDTDVASHIDSDRSRATSSGRPSTVRSARCSSRYGNEVSHVTVKLGQTLIEAGEPSLPLSGKLSEVGVGDLPMPDDSCHSHVSIGHAWNVR